MTPLKPLFSDRKALTDDISCRCAALLMRAIGGSRPGALDTRYDEARRQLNSAVASALAADAWLEIRNKTSCRDAGSEAWEFAGHQGWELPQSLQLEVCRQALRPGLDMVEMELRGPGMFVRAYDRKIDERSAANCCAASARSAWPAERSPATKFGVALVARRGDDGRLSLAAFFRRLEFDAIF